MTVAIWSCRLDSKQKARSTREADRERERERETETKIDQYEKGNSVSSRTRDALIETLCLFVKRKTYIRKRQSYRTATGVNIATYRAARTRHFVTIHGNVGELHLVVRADGDRPSKIVVSGAQDRCVFANRIEKTMR